MKAKRKRSPERSRRIGFIGAGNMGGALIGGIIKSRAVKASDVRVFDADSRKLSALRSSQRICAAQSNIEVTHLSDVIFLCVKPGTIKEVLPSVACALMGSSSRKIIVSIAADIPLSLLQGGLPFRTPVVRVMPNTPALLGAGASALAGGRWASDVDVEKVRKLLATVGETVVLNEHHMNAVTAVSGSGPAYVFYLAEAMKEACRALKLPPEASEILYRQTVLGAGLMLKRLSADAATLRRQVTSPGGTTEAALKYLESRRVRQHVKEAILKAARRAGELTRASNS